MKKNSLNNRTFSLIFLFAYCSFIITGITHYHPYSLLDITSVTSQNSNKNTSHQFITNDFSFCLVNHFSNSILDLNFSSQNVTKFFAEPEKIVLNTDKELPQKFIHRCILYRAPPLEFS